MYRVGVDLGGTKTEAVLVGRDVRPIAEKRVPTPDTYEGIISCISDLVRYVTRDISEFSIGVCTPGVASPGTGMMENSNTRCLAGRPLGDDLQRALGREIRTENDANCFAVAESTFGAARGYGVVFGVIMGTGVGGGLVVDGMLQHGRTGMAGEWGHHTLYPGGNQCYCGRQGCAETYLSGPALERRWQEITGKSLALPEIVSSLGGRDGRKWKDEFLENFGLGLGNVINVLDPDAIVLGGGVSNVGFLYSEGRDSVYRHVFSDRVDTPILENMLGDSAGVYGAALL